MTMQLEKLKPIIEALICAAEQPLSVSHLFDLFSGDIDQPTKDDIRKVLHELVEEYQGRGMQIKQVASGFRLQVNADYVIWITRLLEQKPPRYVFRLLSFGIRFFFRWRLPAKQFCTQYREG